MYQIEHAWCYCADVPPSEEYWLTERQLFIQMLF